MQLEKFIFKLKQQEQKNEVKLEIKILVNIQKTSES